MASYLRTLSKRPLASAVVVGLLLGFSVLVGCKGRSDDGTEDPRDLNLPESGAVEGVKTAEKIEFPEGDPSVPPEQGGPGFTGEGWQTASPGALGDPDAVPGGLFTSSTNVWPKNIRIYGDGANTYLNSIIESLCYESLLGLHPLTLEHIPQLATHWQTDEDNTLFRFRINPKAYWSDGKPVTADDVIATYRLIMDDTLKDPNNKNAISQLEEPRKVSKYIVEVRAKQRNWRNFLTFSSLVVLPAHQIADLTGEQYLDKYSGKLTATTGPYTLLQSDIKQGNSLTFTRRQDYWAENQEKNKGLNNFSRIAFEVIRDQRLAFDKALRGDLDFYAVYTSQWWNEDVPASPAVERGYLVAQEIFTKQPQGFQGMAVNMRRAPLDDVRVRKALAHLFDRRTMLKKFAYDAYTPLKSYFPNSDGENPNNEMVEYDPGKAVELLEQAGFTERGPDGVLQKDGQRLSVKIMFSSEPFTKYFVAYKEACRKVGVEILVDKVDRASEWERMNDHKFELTNANWTGSLFPEPKIYWRSDMADKKASLNVPGFKNEEVDAIIKEYDQEFDLQKRNELLRQLDGILFNEHPYILEWFAPSDRILYKNKFGMPQGVFTKYADWRAVYTYWWIDPQKDAELSAAMKEREPITPPPAEVHYWANHESSPIEQDSATAEPDGAAEASAEVDEEAQSLLEPSPES